MWTHQLVQQEQGTERYADLGLPSLGYSRLELIIFLANVFGRVARYLHLP